jgi:hypothetical protein
MDLADSYYALGIREEDRDLFTVTYRGELWRLACMPMGWSRSANYSCKLTQAFTSYHRRMDTPPTAWRFTPQKPTRRFIRNIRWRGTHLLPYMDDFMFMADSRAAAVLLRDPDETLLHRLELQRNLKKGLLEPAQMGDHLGKTIDLRKTAFRALCETTRPRQAHFSPTWLGSLQGPLALRKTCPPHLPERPSFFTLPSYRRVSLYVNFIMHLYRDKVGEAASA